MLTAALLRPRARAVLAFALFALVLPARTAQAQTALAGETEIARSGHIIVFAENEKLAPEKAKKLLERIQAANDWVRSELHWTTTDVLDHDLAVHVLTDAHMKEQHKGAVGVAVGKHQFLIGESFLEKEASERTLAHELTHLQDHRHLVQKGAKLPHYLTEGRAIAMGLGWCGKLGVSTSRYEVAVVKVLAKTTAESARKILRDDPEKPEKLMDTAFKREMEALGFLFVEFVRTKLAEKGVADVEVRLGRVIEAVGQGAKLTEAFEKEIGSSLEAAQDRFLEHVGATEGKTPERFKGTLLEKAALVAAGASASGAGKAAGESKGASPSPAPAKPDEDP